MRSSSNYTGSFIKQDTRQLYHVHATMDFVILCCIGMGIVAPLLRKWQYLRLSNTILHHYVEEDIAQVIQDDKSVAYHACSSSIA